MASRSGSRLLAVSECSWLTVAGALAILLAPVETRAEADYSKDPVLFVHGYFLGDAGTWSFLKKRLVEAGWPEEYLFSFQFNDVFGCNPEHGEEIEAHAQELMAWTGKDRFDIVCHSMGCVDSRWWIRHMCGYGRVNDFVSIAGANQGSAVACLEPVSCGADQLCVGSDDGDWKDNPFLLELNQCDMTPFDPIRYTAIWTTFDEVVVPSTNSTLDGALNIEVEALVGHGLILSNEETVGYVRTALDGGGKNDNVPPGPQPCVDVCDDFPVEPSPEAIDGPEPIFADQSPDAQGQSDESGNAEPVEQAEPDAATLGDGAEGTGGDGGLPADFSGSGGKDGIAPDGGAGPDGNSANDGDGLSSTADGPPLHIIRRSGDGCSASGTPAAWPVLLLLVTALLSVVVRRTVR